MNVDKVIKRIVLTMTTREREGKEYGVIVIAEGLAELLPEKYLEGIGRDEHGHISIAAVNLHDVFKDLITKEYTAQTGKKRKITALQLGYEVALRQAARVRRDARLPAGRRRVSGAGRETGSTA